ncbi:hypothetical protein OG453_02910 [Streptomyces sp. NBC_01381]|uniref:hypothetical protein n=1 Tax=Streptomyces sp. NBC_01381 TaxID=2903845 RepID=UPI0022554FB0|nr:hypothetical protein [Streptomyces sp. NBC_01381]MCX4665633.1 hypothetical protein [Streptomyces sp. NBC_01381]
MRIRTRTRTRTRLAVALAATPLLSTACGDDEVDTPVLVVGASDQDGKPADFSNFGAQQAVSAPGVGILSTLPTYRTKETLKDERS